jgi:sulfur-carrier protein
LRAERSSPGRRRIRPLGIASPPQVAPATLRNERETRRDAPMTPAHVVLSSGFSRRYTSGAREFDIEAKTMREVLLELDRRYPGLGEHLQEETTVAIDGEIHDQPAYFQKLRPGCEIFFIPKLEGG